ncbi:MAG TPA: hypothetical protein VF611_09325 [Pyrinomonadaceae bacterium]|jgi:hypothetical protein
MTDASTSQGREPNEPRHPEPFFPSEGAFSTVVPLSQVGQAAAHRGVTANAGRPAEADWAREDSRKGGAGAGEEETLVPARVSRARRARRDAETRRAAPRWLATAAVITLSVVAGVAAGTYLVWSRYPLEARVPAAPAADAGTLNQAATEVLAPEPPPAAPPAAPEEVTAAADDAVANAADDTVASAPSAAVATAEKTETPAPARKAEPPSAEPATRRAAETERRAVEAESRAAVRERAKAEAVAPAPAPRPAPRETPPRRQDAPARARPRPPATAATGRALPVSTPPPSSRSRTVIQWP